MASPDASISPSTQGLEPPLPSVSSGGPITAITAIPIALPARRPWSWYGLGTELGRWVIVRVELADGTVGYGEANPLPDWGGDFGRRGGETPETVMHMVDDLLAPLLLGRDPFDVTAAAAAMDARVRGHSYAKAAVEMALHDLRGKLTGRPLYDLLGGRCCDGVVVAHMVGIMGDDAALEEVRAARAEGCRAFQVKGTGELRRDVGLLAALRGEVGDEVALRLDANQSYRTGGPKATIAAVRELIAAGADFVEQPTEGLKEMAAVTAAVEVPVIADESCWVPRDVIEVAEHRAADALSIYVTKAGGISAARDVAILAAHHDLPCDVNGSLESALGTAASLQLALAMPAISLPSVIPVGAPTGSGTTVVGRYYADDISVAPLPFADGMLLPPPGAGLGVEVDEDKLAFFAGRYRESAAG